LQKRICVDPLQGKSYIFPNFLFGKGAALRELRLFLDFLDRHQNEPLVLAKIIGTEGSSYRKTGALKIIAASGDAVGLISGGCLEREIIQRAITLKDRIQTHIFDTTSDVDRLFGYATGCQGKITLSFEKFDSGRLTKADFLEEHGKDLLSIHIIGAGADLDPLHELLQCMGWEHSFYSAQSDIVEERLAKGWQIEKISTNQADFRFQNPERTVVLLMSHNYPTDLEILSQLVDKSVAYIGILGPNQRCQQMLSDLKKIYQKEWPQDQRARIHGPLGLPGFGRGETAIALSVVAHLQQIFYGDRS
jgi:xanthine dehydrogenase accessory factor